MIDSLNNKIAQDVDSQKVITLELKETFKNNLKGSL